MDSMEHGEMMHVSNDNGVGMFLLTVALHLTCVFTGRFSGYNVMAFISHFGLDSVISMVSGIGSIATAWVLVKHYLLRNKLLSKELKEKIKKEREEECE